MSNTAAQSACFHCHQPIPRGVELSVEINDEAQPMCCYGCQAVAQTIVDQGLTHFYKFRTLDANAELPLLPEELSALDQQWQDYDDPQIQQEFVRANNGHNEATLAIEGMTCAACAWLIERQLLQLKGLEKVVVNAANERVNVQWQADTLSLSSVIRAIHKVGYKALPFQHADLEERYEKQRKSYIRRLGVAGIASMQTMMVAFGLYYEDIDEAHRLYFWWVSLLFSAPVFVYSCEPFFRNALRALKARTLNMDVPVSLAIIFAFFASLYATIYDTGEVYYECVTMFAFFLLSGRYLELLARQKAMTNAANLMKLIPAIAERETEQGFEKVMVKNLQPGDRIHVRPGEVVPVDGVLDSERAWLNEAQLTGESRPVVKAKQQDVYAGSINQEHPIVIDVTHTQQNTLLAGIIHLQDHALGQKPRIVQFADSVSKYFVLGTLLIASATYIGWYFVDPDRAFWIVLAVLVATCPCALSLAAPTAMSGAVSRLNRAGILLKQANVLEAMPTIDTVCFDKTGTLTQGHFSILEHWHHDPKQQAANEVIAASFEQRSEHPIAKPFRELAATTAITNLSNTAGAGLEGEINGKTWRLGSLAFIQQWHPHRSVPLAEANVVLADEHEIVAAWRVDDAIRSDAKQVIDWLHKRGIRTLMLSGDSNVRAQHVATKLGIQQVHAQLSPADKLNILKSLQDKNQVLMVGDGINDAPVLAQANASVTFASGSDLAQAGSDAVILSGQLKGLQYLFTTAHKARAIIRQNFTWALGYNGVILPLAVFGFIGPLWAMLGMSMSSVIVMTNSLRLMRTIDSRSFDQE
ncbi:heavy metal translocating P-type ATPase [Aliidiomarina celeris]|uniref:heavy metal translocating P-type ATPase n=1 Tax=Aliidiomarina celeris TaxID=2249428 RepID=UPI001E5912AD|nr:heavy metal translocating P-type ATPase [Aliidiomarina celeris]